MALPFKNGQDLADFLGYGDLYQAAKENEEQGKEVQENIKSMMHRVDDAWAKRNKKDTFD